jgi:hypothetical protein
MAYSVSSLTNYTKENENLLVVSSLFDAKTQDLIRREGNVMSGVKSAETINIMDTDAVFQSDSTCGFNASGTTSITQRTVTVGKIKVNEQLCPRDLEAKYTQKALQAGSDYDSVPFEQDFSARKAGKIAEALETAIWQGDSASVNAQLNKFDGIIKLANAASGSTVAANTTTYMGTAITGFTSSNITTAVDAMWRALPAGVKGKSDVRIFIGWDLFELYVTALRNQNLFHYAADNANGELTIPGTQYKLTAVHGLNSTNRIFALRMSNLFLGVDLAGEEDEFRMWFSEDDDVVKFKARFKMGINFAFPAEIVHFLLA